jgi:hypothetical protein
MIFLIEIEFLENDDNSPTPYGSKAVGEPPFMYGIGVFFAISSPPNLFLAPSHFLTALVPSLLLSIDLRLFARVQMQQKLANILERKVDLVSKRTSDRQLVYEKQ